MYTPPCFQVVDIADLQRTMRESRSATLITATPEGLAGTMLPAVLDESEGSMGTIYAHVARANPQWKLAPTGEGMAIFAVSQAYISLSWYVTKHERGGAIPIGTMSLCMPTGRSNSSMMPIGCWRWSRE